MSLNQYDIQKIAKLSRLYLTAAEEKNIQLELNRIFEMIQKMQQLDTNDVKPLAHLYTHYQYLRADKVTETNHRDLYQSVAPEVEEGLYIVPKVIE